MRKEPPELMTTDSMQLRYEKFDERIDAIRPTMPELSRRFFHYLFDISRVEPVASVTWEDLILGCMLRVMKAERLAMQRNLEVAEQETEIHQLELQLQNMRHTLEKRNRIHREYLQANMTKRSTTKGKPIGKSKMG